MVSYKLTLFSKCNLLHYIDNYLAKIIVDE